MGIVDWFRKNLLQTLKVDLTNLKLKFVFIPVYFVLQIAVYLYFKDTLTKNGFWVLFTPMLLIFVFALIYLIPKRNDPKYQIYYLFHLSMVSKIIILIAAIFLVGLSFYAQCRDYGLDLGAMCFKKIVNP
jgi:cytochrome bd-type quinol oxidase subunit 2